MAFELMVYGQLPYQDRPFFNLSLPVIVNSSSLKPSGSLRKLLCIFHHILPANISRNSMVTTGNKTAGFYYRFKPFKFYFYFINSSKICYFVTKFLFIFK